MAKGCTRVRMIMILDVDVTAERRNYNTYRPLKGKRLTTFCASLALRGPPIGGQENDRVSYPCSNPYTLSRFAGLPLKGKRGTWREKQASHMLHVPFRCSPLWCLTAPPFPRSSVGRQKESALMGRLGALLRPTWRSYAGPPQGTIKLRYAVSCL